MGASGRFRREVQPVAAVLTATPRTAGFFSVNFSLNDGVDQTFHGKEASRYCAIDIWRVARCPKRDAKGQPCSRR